MSFNPDICWDNYIKKITLADQIIKGSFNYYEAVNGYGRIKFGTVISVDFTGFDWQTMQTEGTAMEKTILEFSNGVKLKVRIWYPHAGATTQASWTRMHMFWVNSSGTTFSGSGFGNVAYDLMTYSGGIYYNCTPNLLLEVGLKFVFLTDYATTQTPPTENITNPSRFSLVMYAPQEIMPDQVYKANKLEAVTTDALRSIYYDENNPIVALNYPISALNFEALGTTDIEALYTKLSSAGTLENPFIEGSASDPDEPKQEDDPSFPGGGQGNYDDDSDPIDFPDLPQNGALSSGSIKAFVVGAGTLTSVFLKLWNSSLFDITTYQKLLEEPLSAMVDLLAVPITPTAGTASNIKLGNFDTEISAPTCTQQFYKINLGTLTVNEYWGTAMDYSPYTKAEIFLPFIGIKDLAIDDVMGKTLEVEYNADILTGDLVANIKCGQSVLYKFNGNFKEEIPVSSRVNEKLQKVVSGTAAIGAAAIGGGSFAAAAISAGVNVAFSKRNVSRTGDIQGVPGILDDFECYLIIHRPVQSLPSDFRKMKGYPCNIKAVLSTLTGYTEIEYIHLEGIDGATDAELTEIEQLLKKGVIL